MEWASATLVPVWGTAQSFVRTWSASPAVMQVTALGGATALVFVVVAWQALAARVVVSGGSARRSAAVALVLLGAAVVGAGQHRASAPAPGARTLRVAAIGWRSGEAQALGRRGDPGPTLALYEPLLGQAAAAGARLVVSPEVGFTLGGERTAETLARLGALARRHRVWLVVGYFDRDHRDNHAALIGPDGARAGDYRKTHLIPLLERYRAGDGRLVTADLGGGAAAGAMICQDDNFTDLARGYGRRGVALVAVPTFDWAEVAPYHYESSRFRAVEAGYGVVRAAVDGTSAITDARGHVLAERNHLAAGRGVVIADLPLHAGGTLYATAGAFVPLLWIAVLLVVAVRSARRRQ
jgi:apolipoprotein N-acyltransferase